MVFLSLVYSRAGIAKRFSILLGHPFPSSLASRNRLIFEHFLSFVVLGWRLVQHPVQDVCKQ